MNFVDTHAHLDFAENPQAWIDGAKGAGVSKIICVGTSVDASRKCVEIADKYTTSEFKIFASVGIHAQDGKADIGKFGSLTKCIEELRKILDPLITKVKRGKQVENDKVVVGVGECGFDIRRTSDNLQGLVVSRQVTTDKEIDFQRELFEAQIKLAKELDLPLLIHCRNAWEETFELLEQIQGTTSPMLVRGRTSNFSSVAPGLFHSWTGGWDEAQKALELGFYISFSGIVTFKNAPLVQEVAVKMPLDRMLLETDSPYLAPEPMRGSPNEPKNVRIVAGSIAKLRGISLDELAKITSKNAAKLFGI